MAELNPALQRFVDTLHSERVWCQVLIRTLDDGFRLCHVVDRDRPKDQLRQLQIKDLRSMAMFNATGQFRPLRAAPDLVGGWVFECRSPAELGRAIQDIYPGSIPDWHAVERSEAHATGYREFTNRQSGMYRITQLLTDEQAAQAIRACCDPHFCLKRRFWTVEGLAADPAESKSAIPCLEPCAVLLELARKAARIEQEEKAGVQLARSDLESFLAAAKMLAQTAGHGERVGNIASATNVRRLQLLVEKYGAALKAAQTREEE